MYFWLLRMGFTFPLQRAKPWRATYLRAEWYRPELQSARPCWVRWEAHRLQRCTTARCHPCCTHTREWSECWCCSLVDCRCQSRRWAGNTFPVSVAGTCRAWPGRLLSYLLRKMKEELSCKWTLKVSYLYTPMWHRGLNADSDCVQTTGGPDVHIPLDPSNFLHGHAIWMWIPPWDWENKGRARCERVWHRWCFLSI